MYYSWSKYWGAVALASMGAVGGGAMTRVNSGWEAAYFAWKIGFAFLGIYIFAAALVWSLQKKSIRFVHMTTSLFVVSMLSFILIFILPAYFLMPIWSTPGALLTAFWLTITAWQCHRVSKYFAKKWLENSSKAIDKSFKNKAFYFDAFKKQLDLDAPDILSTENKNDKYEMARYIAALLVVVSLLIGFSLRKVFPVFSTFAYVIPMCLVSTWLFQTMVILFHYYKEFSLLEKNLGRSIVPADTG
jgi:hypothetical protein